MKKSSMFTSNIMLHFNFFLRCPLRVLDSFSSQMCYIPTLLYTRQVSRWHKTLLFWDRFVSQCIYIIVNIFQKRYKDNWQSWFKCIYAMRNCRILSKLLAPQLEFAGSRDIRSRCKHCFSECITTTAVLGAVTKLEALNFWIHARDW